MSPHLAQKTNKTNKLCGFCHKQYGVSLMARCKGAPAWVFCPRESLLLPEGWPSGLRRTLGKRVCVHAYRGFESHSLRQYFHLSY